MATVVVDEVSSLAKTASANRNVEVGKGYIVEVAAGLLGTILYGCVVLLALELRKQTELSIGLRNKTVKSGHVIPSFPIN